MGDRYADLDAALAEDRRGRSKTGPPKPVTVTLFGERWNLGYTLPAKAVMLMHRLRRVHGENANLSDPTVSDDLYQLAEALIPAPVMDEWFARGIDIDELGAAVMFAMSAHYSGDTGEDHQGEAQAPEAGASASSSNDGGSSQPTSTASTGSTSPETSTA